MKIYIGHSQEHNYKNRLYKPLKESALNKKHKLILPHETSSFLNSKETIVQCDLFIAEISYPSIGLGIELGWANSFQVPVICIYKKGSSFSKSIGVVSNIFIEYKDPEDLIKKIEPKIK